MCASSEKQQKHHHRIQNIQISELVYALNFSLNKQCEFFRPNLHKNWVTGQNSKSVYYQQIKNVWINIENK